MKKIFVIVGIISYLATALFAQAQENYSVSQSKLIFHGKTVELSKKVNLAETKTEKKAQYKKDKLAPNNFFNRPERKLARPDLEHQGDDQLRKLGRSASSTAELEVMVNRDGLSNGSVFPLDPTGSIGLEYYVQAINATRIGVYRKTGDIVTSFSGNTLWSDINRTSAGDPIIMYDQELSRWIITEFTERGINSLLIAVSVTEDPLGEWYTYEFVAPNFPDYPKYGIWNDHFVITTNENGPGQLHNYFIDRHALMAGEDDVSFQRVTVNGVNPGFIESPILITVPVDWEGQLKPTDPRPMILRLNDSSWGQSGQDGINIYQYDVDFDVVANTEAEVTFIPTSPYDGYPCLGSQTFSCLPQRNGGLIAAIPETIMNTVQHRNFGTHESVVLAFITDVTNGNNLSGIRWMELRKDDADAPWYLYQEGTYSPDNLVHRFMPTIAIDRLGCISIAYSVTSDDDFVGLRLTGRCPEDPLGEMTVPEYTVVEGNTPIQSQQTNNAGQIIGIRYGDYAHLSVDPNDELTMWLTAEYAGGINRAVTRLVSYRLTRDSIDIAMNGLINIESGVGFTNSEILEASIVNNGKTPITSYEVGYLINGVEQEKTTINQTIASAEQLDISFSVPADLSERGVYEITTFVNYVSDFITTNDTSSTVINHYNDYDAITEILPMFSGCGVSRDYEIQITNQGALPITDGVIVMSFNGQIVDSILTFGPDIEFGESRDYRFSLEAEMEEENILEARFINLETQEEATPSNNIDRYQFPEDFLALEMLLTLVTDNSPNETTWEVTSQATGEVIASGGPYLEAEVLIEENFCVHPDSCYTFTMFDAGGDGLCCDNGSGIYNVGLVDAGVLFNGSIFFGSEDINNFCPSNTNCSLDADFNIGYESSSDLGSILITANSGVGPFTYSIDGGVTFQEENLFTDLEPGEYDVVVRAAVESCMYSEKVLVDVSTNVLSTIDDNIEVLVRPNPTDGFFNVEVSGYTGSENWFTFQIIDATGKLVQERKITKYNDLFTTQISLLAYPDGMYYFRLINSDINSLTKIIKQ